MIQTQPKQRYKVTANNLGELLTIYTAAHNEAQAKRNAYHQIADRLKLSLGAVSMRLSKPNKVRVEKLWKAIQSHVIPKN